MATKKFTITTAFIDGATSQLKAPGTYDLEAADAKRYLAEGRGNYADAKDQSAAESKSEEAEDTDEDEGDELPEDFPSRDALIGGGFDTVKKLRGASQEDLLGIEGIGEATMNKIAAALDEI